MKKYKKNTFKLEKTGFIKGEMLKTHGSNKKLKKFFGNIKFTNLNKGIDQTIQKFKQFDI